MKDFVDELDQHYDEFASHWSDGLAAARATLSAQTPTFRESYRRIATLNAWRTSLLAERLSEPCHGLFFESQNDAIVSHVFAQMGSWRIALQGLRSVIENTLLCLYFMDHPIELTQWQGGGHRLTFTELKKYFAAHPLIVKVSDRISGLPEIEKEYATLSQAVHGSNVLFRMTSNLEETQLWNTDKARLGAWQTREKQVMSAVNRLLLTLFQGDLKGSARTGLRKSVSLAVGKGYHAEIQAELGIRLFVVP